MAVDYPKWYTLKANIVTILQAVATAENAESTARNFKVQKDRWRPWIESEHNTPLVNVMVQGATPDDARSSSRNIVMDEVTVNVDMYVVGEAGETLPVDELAANRLDLLVAQVRKGLTTLDKIDYGFEIGEIDRSQKLTLSYYDQVNESLTGQYAPARWSFSVILPFEPSDETVYYDLEELNVSVTDETLDLYALKFNYSE